MREKALGPDHLEVAASLNNLAVLLKTAGADEEAEALYSRSIRIKEAALGPNHPQVSLPAQALSPRRLCGSTPQNVPRAGHPKPGLSSRGEEAPATQIFPVT